jgi:N utilization substance protein B
VTTVSPTGRDGASPRKRSSSRARSSARRLAMQALYQWQLNKQPWQDLHLQFSTSEEGALADPDYFRELLQQCVENFDAFNAGLQPFADRTLEGLDPIEHAILVLGYYELKSRIDVPYRVALNEAVELARKFGATDGHKFVNAVLDRAAGELRTVERERG